MPCVATDSCLENIFVAARVLAHRKLRTRFLVSKYAAIAGRCFDSLIGLQIDELTNYDRTFTIIVISSFLFYKLPVITLVKLMTVSSLSTSKLHGHQKPRKIAGCMFFLFAVCSKI